MRWPRAAGRRSSSRSSQRAARCRASAARACWSARDEAVGTIGGGHLELKAIAAGARDARARRASRAQRAALRARPVARPVLRRRGDARASRRSTPSALARWPRRRAAVPPAAATAPATSAARSRRCWRRSTCEVDWIDERDDEFPRDDARLALAGAHPPHRVDTVEPRSRHAPAGACYLVLTHEHDLDLRITEAILRRGDFAFCGLIGSKTKRARFVAPPRGARHRRRAAIARLTCPIGVGGIAGKAAGGDRRRRGGAAAGRAQPRNRATIGSDDETTASRSRLAIALLRARAAAPKRTSTGSCRTASRPRPRRARSASRIASAPAGRARRCRATRRGCVRFALVDAHGRAADRGRRRRRAGRARSTLRRPGIAVAVYRSTAVAAAARRRGVRELPARGRAGRVVAARAPNCCARRARRRRRSRRRATSPVASARALTPTPKRFGPRRARSCRRRRRRAGRRR